MRSIAFLFFISTVFVSCEHQQTKETFSNRKLPPPEIDQEIDTKAMCEALNGSEKITPLSANKFLITDSVNIYSLILFSKILFDDYGLIARPSVDSIDRTCIKPAFKKRVEQEFAIKNVSELINAVKTKVKIIQDSIGLFQIRRGLYYGADVLPKYNGEPGVSYLYNDVEESRKKHKRTSENEGCTMFYLAIDKTGNVQQVEIRQHLDKETDSLSKLIMLNLPHKWTPAKVNGKDVDFYLQYAIRWR